MRKFIFIILFWFLSFPINSFSATRTLSCEEVTQLLTIDQTKSYKTYDNNWVLEGVWYDDNKWSLLNINIGGIWVSSICNYTWNIIEPDISIDSKFDTSLAMNLERLVIIWQWEPKYYAQRAYTRSLFIEDLGKLNQNIANKQLSEIKTNFTTMTNLTGSGVNLDEFNKSIEESKKAIEQKTQSEAKIMPTTTETKKILSSAWQKKALLLKKRIEILQKQIAQLQKQLDSLK